MEMWMQIAIGIAIGESIILILKSLKNKISNYDPFEERYYVRDPERMMNESKEEMKCIAVECCFGVFVWIIAIIGIEMIGKL